jgi:spore coat polysaccharide biosynthesis protein SpsF (cytidylyltransferase family)
MRIGAITLCRLDSSRLPGKVLKLVQGQPLLQYVLTRCRQVEGLTDLVVATSDRPIDDAIADFCQQADVKVFRGSTQNVTRRLLDAAMEQSWNYVFRINADSPFLEPDLLSQAIRLIEQTKYDLVTNLYPRSFPYGVSVELIRVASLQKAIASMYTPEHFEHVTQFFYQNMEQFQYYNIARTGTDLSKIRLTVDTETDFRRFEQAIVALGSNWLSVPYTKVVELYKNLSSTL